jgi:hypothetical protein
MHRLVGPVWLLLFGVSAGPLTAQRSGAAQSVVIEEPRPNPILPAAIVPFTIGPEFCRNGNSPAVKFEVRNVLVQSVATLRMRGGARPPIDGLTLRCGSSVATWDGLVDGGGDGEGRLAPPGTYYLRLTVTGTGMPPRAVVRTLIVPQS